MYEDRDKDTVRDRKKGQEQGRRDKRASKQERTVRARVSKVRASVRVCLVC